jgi:hypothetical protein
MVSRCASAAAAGGVAAADAIASGARVARAEVRVTAAATVEGTAVVATAARSMGMRASRRTLRQLPASSIAAKAVRF